MKENEEITFGMAVLMLVLLVGISVLTEVFLRVIEGNSIDRVKSGKVDLICFINDEYVLIDPNKIVDKQDNIYIFTNGSAKNCKEKDNGKI